MRTIDTIVEQVIETGTLVFLGIITILQHEGNKLVVGVPVGLGVVQYFLQ